MLSSPRRLLPRKETIDMATHHEGHTHNHGPSCGHTGILHDGHVDYLHDGHMHHQNGSTVEEHTLAVNSTNPATCTPAKDSRSHDKTHKHGPKCGHAAVPPSPHGF